MQPVGQRDLLGIILQHVDKADLSNVPRVCRLWNQVYNSLKDNLTSSILPVGKSDLKALLSQGITPSLLERFVQDPRALTKIYYFFLSYFTDLPQEQRTHYLQAATHFAMHISNNENESRDSTYSEYRYAGSAYYYTGNYQKAKEFYIEAKKRALLHN